jgi:hypothetical protein
MKTQFRVLIMAVLGLVMTSCDALYTSHLYQNTPCLPPQGISSVLIYPAPGSTGIPDNVGQIVFASFPTALSTDYRAFLKDNDTFSQQTSNQVFQANFGPFQFMTANPPSPAAVPPFNNPVYQASENTGVTIPQGHTVTVFLAQVKCNATQAYGNFTVR